MRELHRKPRHQKEQHITEGSPLFQTVLQDLYPELSDSDSETAEAFKTKATKFRRNSIDKSTSVGDKICKECERLKEASKIITRRYNGRRRGSIHVRWLDEDNGPLQADGHICSCKPVNKITEPTPKPILKKKSVKQNDAD